MSFNMTDKDIYLHIAYTLDDWHGSEKERKTWDDWREENLDDCAIPHWKKNDINKTNIDG